MLKLCTAVVLLIISACSAAYHLPQDIRDNLVNPDNQVVYSPSSNFWSEGGMVEDRIVFTKYVSVGSGSYSEYRASGAELYMDSTSEFLLDGRLIGYNPHDLKFFEAVYQNGIFKSVEMMPDQVAGLFPGLEIVKLSTVKDGVVKVKKLPFQTKSFLLLNDTPISFYHYSFEDFKGFDGIIKGLLTVEDYRNIVFSHFGSRDDKINPVLTIKVVPGL